MSQSGYASNLFPKIILQNYSPKQLPKSIPQNSIKSCSPKLNSKANPQRCYSKLLCQAAPAHIPQKCFTKFFPKTAPQNYSPKYLCKTIAPKRLSFKPVPRSGSPKLFFKVASESCPQKLCSKAIPKNWLFPKLLLRKIAPPSYSCFPKLLPKVSPQSCSTKQFPKAKPRPKIPKLLSKAAPNSCSPKLLKLPPKVVVESCFPKLLSKATPQSCRSSNILRQCCCKAAKLLPTVVPQSCSPKLLPKAASQRSSPKQRAQAKEASTVCAVEGGCSNRGVLQRCLLERVQRQFNTAQARQAKAIISNSSQRLGPKANRIRGELRDRHGIAIWDQDWDSKMTSPKTRWAKEPKTKTAHSTPFFKNLTMWAVVLCTKST